LRGLSNDFHLCHTHGTFYYRLKEGAPEATAVEPVAPARRWNGTPLPRIDDDTSWVEIVRGAAERIHALADVSRELSALPVPATPRLPDLHSVLEQLGSERFDRALEQLGALPPEQANEPEALLLRAVSAAHSGALAQAEQTCRSLIERDELSAGAHYVLALCREGLGDVAGAIEQDQIAVYLDPGFAMARLHLGLLARRRGEKATARRELAQALVSLQQEDASRLLLFGGGFNRQALIALCQAELSACGEHA
jgi:chemotaxis protein methyltransferase CheR